MYNLMMLHIMELVCHRLYPHPFQISPDLYMVNDFGIVAPKNDWNAFETNVGEVLISHSALPWLLLVGYSNNIIHLHSFLHRTSKDILCLKVFDYYDDLRVIYSIFGMLVFAG